MTAGVWCLAAAGVRRSARLAAAGHALPAGCWRARVEAQRAHRKVLQAVLGLPRDTPPQCVVALAATGFIPAHAACCRYGGKQCNGAGAARHFQRCSFVPFIWAPWRDWTCPPTALMRRNKRCRSGNNQCLLLTGGMLGPAALFTLAV